MPTSKPLLLAAAISAVLLGGAAQIPARADSVADGRNIAVRWCSSCHDVGAGERRAANDMAPNFPSVAQRSDLTRSQLETWIGNPHPPMPNLHLTRQEIENLVDYIQSLRAPQ